MKYGRKALSMPMEIIIAVVVLVVIALAVIMFTTGGITKAGGTTQDTATTAGAGTTCQAQGAAWCANNPLRENCRAGNNGECTSCATDYSCARDCRPVYSAAGTCPAGTKICAGLGDNVCVPGANQVCCI